MEVKDKRRVLFVGEASFLATGFSTYWNEVIKRLHETGEFELAEMGCIPNPYSLIQMSDGSLKPISLVQIGDSVVTHTGQSRKVTQTFKREAKEKIIEIQREFFGGTCLKLTSNHKVFVIPREKSYLYNDPKRGSWNKNATGEWIKASDIRPKDLVAYSTIKDFEHNKTTIKRHGLSVPLNDDFAFLAGWFLAEGYIGHQKKLGENHFGVCASLKEEKHIKRFCDCLRRLFNIETNYRTRKDMGVYEIKVHNRIVTQFLQSLFGSSCYSKFIDPELFSGSQDFLLKLIGAYAEGDGHSSIERNDIIIKTASKQLGLDVVRVLLQLGIRCSFRKQRNAVGYLLTIAGQYANQLAKHFVYKNKNFNDLQREETLQINNLLFMKVTQIHRYDYEGPVYNLEVEDDNSYICDNYVVHNSYAHDDDPHCQQVPWKFYPVAPARSNQPLMQKYMSNPTSQFGEWRFDDVCLDFKPDVVCSLRDFWMDEFILRSPSRKNFSFLWQLTIDGEPQRELWLDAYEQCDRVLTYSEYGMNLLKRTGRAKTNLVTIASPGADLEIFKPPENKRDHKSKLGIDPNSLIVGTVARNQKRKLYYDLIESFGQWLHHSKSKGHTELAKRTFLYLHTSYPDVGYDIGKAIIDFKVGNKVIMTYLCSNCQTAYPSFFAGAMMICRKCGKLAAHPPNAGHSCPRNVLADIMKTFDLYVQYSICWEPGTQIWMGDGTLKPIESICVGDSVLTHDNKIQQVTEVFESDADESVAINIFGDNKTYKCTANHPIWTQRGWVRANNLVTSSSDQRRCGDWIGQPIPDLTQNTNDILDIDPYVLGVLIGDGWIGKDKRIGVSLGNNKVRAIAAIRKFIKGNSHERDRNGAAIEITWSDKQFVQNFTEILGKGARHKRIPTEIWKSTLQYTQKLLLGFFDTDGHKSKCDYRFYTSSETLAYQCRILLAACGIISSVNKHHRKDRDDPEYCVIIKGNASKIAWNAIRQGIPPPNVLPSKRNVFLKIEDNMLWSKVQSIGVTQIEGKVYNLEVENMEGGDSESSHSYVAGSISCHNCEGWG